MALKRPLLHPPPPILRRSQPIGVCVFMDFLSSCWRMYFFSRRFLSSFFESVIVSRSFWNFRFIILSIHSPNLYTSLSSSVSKLCQLVLLSLTPLATSLKEYRRPLLTKANSRIGRWILHHRKRMKPFSPFGTPAVKQSKPPPIDFPSFVTKKWSVYIYFLSASHNGLNFFAS